MANRWGKIRDKLAYDRNLKDQWTFSYQFLYTCIAAMYTFTTIVDFARLVYSWGGLFLIQYMILLLTVGFPMVYVESVLGQFSSCSAIYVYNICPAAVGLGIGSVIYTFITSLYHYAIILYSLTYAFFSCYVVLPWSRCDSWWHPSKNCFVPGKKLALPSCDDKERKNLTVGVDCIEWTSAAEEFWRRYILESDVTESISFSNIQWLYVLVVCLIWFLTFVISSKGIRVLAKFSWAFVMTTSLLLLIFTIFSLTLDGASRGVAQGFAPKLMSLIKMNSWKEAAVHIMVSLNINYGIMATYSSCNHFTQTTLHRDLMILCLEVVLSSVCACIFVFCIVGNLAFKLRKSMDELMPEDSWSLCFVLVPQALSNVIWPQFWSFLFFIYLSLLPFAFHFATIQVVIISIIDGAPRLHSLRKWMCLFYCLFGAIVGFGFANHKGKEVYEFFRIYCLPSIPFPFLFAVGKIIIVAWIYGWQNFIHDVEFMLGISHSWLLTVCVSFIDPFTIFFLFIHCSSDFLIDASDILSDFPVWSQVIGSFLILLPVLPSLIGFISDARKHKLHKESLFDGFEATHAWGPSNPIFYQDYYDWLKERPEYTSFSVATKHKRRRRRLTDDEIVFRRKAAVRRRLSVVTDSLIKIQGREVLTQVAEGEESAVSSVSKSHTEL